MSIYALKGDKCLVLLVMGITSAVMLTGLTVLLFDCCHPCCRCLSEMLVQCLNVSLFSGKPTMWRALIDKF